MLKHNDKGQWLALFPWSQENVAYLRTHYREKTDAEIALALQTTPGTVRTKRIKLGLKKNTYKKNMVRAARNLSIVEANNLREEALRLRRKSNHLGPRRIGAMLGISHKMVEGWIYSDRIPHRPMAKSFKLEPSPELAYFMGAFVGDGSYYHKDGINNTGHGAVYQIRLRVKDKEFAERFAEIGASLQNKALGKVRLLSSGLWCTEVQSKKLGEYITAARWKELLQTHPSGFISGFFDAEGSVLTRRIICHNTNFELLLQIQNILSTRWGIKASLYEEKRSLAPRYIMGVLVKTSKPCYTLQIASRKGLLNFIHSVGFEMPRKKAKQVILQASLE